MKLYLLLILSLLSVPQLVRGETITLFDAEKNPLLQFGLPGSPAVSDFLEGEYFTTYGISETYGTVLVGFGSTDYAVQFYLAGAFGYDLFTGSQLYVGDESTPSLLAGTYDLSSLEGLPYTLTIDRELATTPEPSSFLLCGSGGFLLLYAFWLRRTLVVTA